MLNWAFMLKFPKMDSNNHSVESRRTSGYDCIAWAYGVDTETASPSRYWNELKANLFKESDQLFGGIEKLPMPGADGRNRATDAANTETLFRIIQSVPSSKAEPFKRWLARTGYERMLEMQNPEIAIKRAIMDYRRTDGRGRRSI